VLTVLMGLPGSGKTTLAQRVRALAPQLTVLSRDVIRRELFPRPDYSASEKHAVFAELLRCAGLELAAGRDVLIDGMTFSHTAERADAAKLAAAAGAAFLAVHCDCPVEVALERVRLEAAGATAHPAGDRNEALVREVAERFEPVSPEAERLDMRADPERLARELRALIEHARGA
jgi:predicted kinase